MLTPLGLDRGQPLQRQIYDQLRELIASGRLQGDTRMPSSRMMAERFQIARITAVLTYERLIAEGLLVTRPASGTFLAPSPASGQAAPVLAPVAAPVGGRAEHGTPVGRPDPSLFPSGRWRVLMRAALDRLGSHVRSEDPGGDPRLRSAIAAWLSTSRGLAVAQEQVVIRHGRQQGLHLAAHPALGRDSRLVLEDPCDSDAIGALASDGVVPVHVPVDDEGLRPDGLPTGDAALLHMTPEHQRPLGVVLAASRRRALLAWAARSGALVLEDDCDGELHYGFSNMPSPMTLDEGERVIRLGGFSLSLGPWVSLALPRIGGRLAA